MCAGARVFRAGELVFSLKLKANTDTNTNTTVFVCLVLFNDHSEAAVELWRQNSSSYPSEAAYVEHVTKMVACDHV